MCARGTFLESDIAITGDVRAFSFGWLQFLLIVESPGKADVVAGQSPE